MKRFKSQMKMNNTYIVREYFFKYMYSNLRLFLNCPIDFCINWTQSSTQETPSSHLQHKEQKLAFRYQC